MTTRVGLTAVAALMALAACNPGAAPSALLRLEAEMAGERCPHGGVAVLTGLDRNGNLALDDGEVDGAQTRYVCNGAPGVAGQPGDAGTAGQNALSTVTAEPSGTNCRYGGVRIDVGVDTDGNGALDAAEITGTRYVCDRASTDAIYFGDLVIRDQADVALLAGIQVVAGSLFIEGAPGGTLTLPELRVISGRLDFSAGDGGSVGAPPVLTSATFPELRRVGDLGLRYRPDVVSVSFPKLERAGHVDVMSNDELTGFSAPLLAQAESLSIYSNAKLASLTLPALARVVAFDVGYNTLLATLSMPALRTIERSLSINDNPALSHCAAYRVVAGLSRTSRYSPFLSNNDQAPTCTTADFCGRRTLAGVSDALQVCVVEKVVADAQAACTGFGASANLLWVTSATEWAALQAAAIDGALGWPSWIGYSDATTEGTWVAMNGFSAYDVTARTDFWESGQPGDGTAGNFAVLTGSGVVDDRAGTTPHGFICRVP